jgi:twitching motility protein PilT
VTQAAAWLLAAVERGASDLHLVAGHPPTMRLHGELSALAEPVLSQEQVWATLEPLLPETLRERFAAEKNSDFALVLEGPQGPQRFRANYFVSGQSVGACFRVIPDKIPSFEWAGFPLPLADRLIHFRNGLVLLCGVTGSGKTTTLAMLVDLLIREGGYRVLTIEEPIEYVFPRTADSVVTQREVGRDVQSFADGLKYGLRQDPDVILVGEIRDRDTGQIALSAAETGHLVLATMHTRDAKGAISRYADLFPQSVQTEIRAQLATALRAVISQHLLPSIVPGEKRELALEVLFNNSAVAAAIRQGKLESIDNCLVTGRADGMLPLSESIRRLFRAERISEAVACEFVDDPGVLRR